MQDPESDVGGDCFGRYNSFQAVSDELADLQEAEQHHTSQFPKFQSGLSHKIEKE